MMLDHGLVLVAAAALMAACLRAPWARFRDSTFQHLFCGAAVVTFFFWQMRAPIGAVMPIHLLCLTTMTLMFGRSLAVLIGAVVAVGTCMAGLENWAALPRNFLGLGVVPVIVSWAVFRASQRWLPPNPFVYLFVAAFFGAAAAMLTAAATTSVLLLGSAEASLGQITSGYLPALPLLVFPEAFINGAVVTGLVVFKPDWIPTFDDRLYLER